MERYTKDIALTVGAAADQVDDQLGGGLRCVLLGATGLPCQCWTELAVVAGGERMRAIGPSDGSEIQPAKLAEPFVISCLVYLWQSGTHAYGGCRTCAFCNRAFGMIYMSCFGPGTAHQATLSSPSGLCIAYTAAALKPPGWIAVLLPECRVLARLMLMSQAGISQCTSKDTACWAVQDGQQQEPVGCRRRLRGRARSSLQSVCRP